MMSATDESTIGFCFGVPKRETAWSFGVGWTDLPRLVLFSSLPYLSFGESHLDGEYLQLAGPPRSSSLGVHAPTLLACPAVLFNGVRLPQGLWPAVLVHARLPTQLAVPAVPLACAC